MRRERPSTPEVVTAEFAERFGYLDRVATLLDAQYRVPFTRIRFGWDAIVGLLPVVGDLLMAGVSLHLIVCARRLGADDRLAFRMVINLLVDTLVGAIPIIGSLLDIFFAQIFETSSSCSTTSTNTVGPASRSLSKIHDVARAALQFHQRSVPHCGARLFEPR